MILLCTYLIHVSGIFFNQNETSRYEKSRDLKKLDYLHKQHEPNPEAHDLLAWPPLLEHSSCV